MNKKRKIIVAIISTLSIVAVVLGIIVFCPQQQQQHNKTFPHKSLLTKKGRERNAGHQRRAFLRP